MYFINFNKNVNNPFLLTSADNILISIIMGYNRFIIGEQNLFKQVGAEFLIAV